MYSINLEERKRKSDGGRRHRRGCRNGTRSHGRYNIIYYTHEYKIIHIYLIVPLSPPLETHRLCSDQCTRTAVSYAHVFTAYTHTHSYIEVYSYASST